MNKLYLHIGSYKTGTTSIQNALAINRKILAKQGFMYPGRDVNHHKFIFSCHPSGDDIPRQFRGLNQMKLKQIISAFFKGLEKDFSCNYDNYIISTEYLFIYEKTLVAQTINYLKRFFSDIEVVVFVRNPADYYVSSQQQKIKARSYIDSPTSFRYDFKKVIETWKSFFPVQVLKHERGVDSLEVLCNAVGIDLSNFESAEKRINTSLTIEQMLLLEKIQSRLYRSNEDRFKNHLGVLHQIKRSGLHKPELKRDVQKLIDKNHHEDRLWLKEEFGIVFQEEEYNIDSPNNLPSFERDKATVRDVFKVPKEQTVEKFEVHIIDLLLKKLVQLAS